jgi:hypothetical protein
LGTNGFIDISHDKHLIPAEDTVTCGGRVDPSAKADIAPIGGTLEQCLHVVSHGLNDM